MSVGVLISLAIFSSLIGLPAGASSAEAVGQATSEVSRQDAVLLAKFDGERKKRGKRKRRGSEGDDGGGGPAAEPCTACAGLDGFVAPGEIGDDIRLMVGKVIGGDKAHAVEVQKARGGIETGLEAKFIDGGDCPEIDSEAWAIDYSHKRPWPAIHTGVDIPQPRVTPVRAGAAGTVVGRFLNDGNRKGIEVVLRHNPAETGLGVWTYSQYTHLLEMSPLAIGAHVAMGDEIGKTSNTGKMGRRERRDALHFAIIYSALPEWSNDGIFVTPKDGYWMDPNAFYRLGPPYDSQSLAALADDQKAVAVPYMKADGSVMPAETKRIWPYPCQ